MGHIEIMSHCIDIPRDISEYIIYNYLVYSLIKVDKDKSGLGYRFYILGEGVNKINIFKYNDTIVNIQYELDMFNPDRMIWIS